jgi:four helix bundle protein
MASAILTLAEGNAKRSSRAERRRFFEMSLGSIAEVSSCLDLACVFRLNRQDEFKAIRSSLRLSSVMIDKLP